MKVKVKAYFLRKGLKESTKMTIAILLLQQGARLILQGEYLWGGALVVAGWVLLLINYAMVRVYVSR